MKRKLTTILCADVVGYSRLVADDEEEALRRLVNYRGVFESITEAADGRIFNTAGDAVLAEFGSTVNAVRAAIDIQESIRTRNLAVPTSRQMTFRIGIAIGDVVVQKDDLLGDAVNIAARLQTLAEPGGICLSNNVREQVYNKLSAQFRDIGAQTLKNIPSEVRAYVLETGHPEEKPDSSAGVAAKKWLPTAAAAGVILALAGGAFLYFQPGTSPPLQEKSAQTQEAPQTLESTEAPAKKAATAAAAKEIKSDDEAAATPDKPTPSADVKTPTPASPTKKLAEGAAEIAETAETANLREPAAETPAISEPAQKPAPKPLKKPAANRPPVTLAGRDFEANLIPFVCDACRAKVGDKLKKNTKHNAVAINAHSDTGFAWSRKSAADAKRIALTQCHNYRGRECELYAVDNVVVWPRSMPAMPAVPWAQDQPTVSFFERRLFPEMTDEAAAKVKTEYSKAPSPKALALGTDGAWSYYFNGDSIDEVIRQSLQSCAHYQTFGACRVIAVNDRYVHQ